MQPTEVNAINLCCTKVRILVHLSFVTVPNQIICLVCHLSDLLIYLRLSQLTFR